MDKMANLEEALGVVKAFRLTQAQIAELAAKIKQAALIG
jgi:hypothetical protein